MGIIVRILKANHGDCILVSHESSSGTLNLLIDGGPATTFRYGIRQRYSGALSNALDDLKGKGQNIDLAILTHIDDDHINGFIKAFESPNYLRQMVKSIWFNSSRLITHHFNVPEICENNIFLQEVSSETSVKQGQEFEALLDEIGCARAPLIMAGQIYKVGPITLTALSPERRQLEQLLHKWPTEVSSADTSSHENDYHYSLGEIWADDRFESDPSIYNGSSIAFLLEADDKKMLFLGDASDQVVTKNLRALGYSEMNKLKLDLVKVSHHGSQYNTSNEFLSILDSPCFVISTNGLKHGLPNKRTIARILKETDGDVYFNYSNVIAPLLLAHETESYSSRLKVLGDEIKF
ncbi:MBL fold metallo-hydrolase [Serratia marcescens]|uniref:ComEC/Rec2 family competence protein n=1 Tax=Serratia TaxID=613 RepID=UPI000660628E|nr:MULTISPECIES: MBL fold metallo-hydrolase [Serratia]MBN5248995.1 MBL fold metallo-hydrolase [Serratia marcescens]MBN5257263.1 MBL fold metallo-hydrolase [Serratia marcescens]MBN5353537.1 MBL fold metallo-hydrolase [Serratia marcescens]MCW6023889.1 MBL fold metallo-hydrolase [Serratia marcescens]UOG69756.1 MBL fold metallo-hydrolase [Serratia marcescens]